MTLTKPRYTPRSFAEHQYKYCVSPVFNVLSYTLKNSNFLQSQIFSSIIQLLSPVYMLLLPGLALNVFKRQEGISTRRQHERSNIFPAFIFFIFFLGGLETAAGNFGSMFLKNFSPQLFPLLYSAFRKMWSHHKHVKQELAAFGEKKSSSLVSI